MPPQAAATVPHVGVDVHRPGEDVFPVGIDDFSVWGIDAFGYLVNMTVQEKDVALKHVLIGYDCAVANQCSHCKVHLSFIHDIYNVFSFGFLYQVFSSGSFVRNTPSSA